MSTEYILSLSYGKDSLACLEACKQLGYPIDRVVHAEVWATDTIPADLPPMVEFKAKADAIIKERYGLTVEHICATVKRERERNSLTKDSSIQNVIVSDLENNAMVSLSDSIRGVSIDSRTEPLTSCEKLTYEKIFYRPMKRRAVERERERGFTAFPSSEGIGVRAISSNRLCDSVESVLHRGTQETSPYGFPISVHRGNWCTKLKQQVF